MMCNFIEDFKNALYEAICEVIIENSFLNHTGQKGKVGGSLPRGSYQEQKDRLDSLAINYKEFKYLVSELNTHVERNKQINKMFLFPCGDCLYKVYKYDVDEYKIYDKIIIEDFD